MKKKADKKVDFIRLAPIVDIVRTAIWTARLIGEKPASVILIAEQESAKTEILKYFRGTETLEYVSDLTQSGIAGYQKEIEAGKLRHFVILDLVRVVSHNLTVTGRTIQQLSTLIEEGEATTADGGGRTIWKESPVIGCITALTPAYFKKNAGQWRKTGFLSRFLPIRFRYSESTISLIHNAIACGHKMPEPRGEKLPAESIKVDLPEKFADEIRRKAQNLGSSNHLAGFRYHRQLRAFTKAHALRHGRNRANETDLAKVLSWSDFFTEQEVEL